MDRTTGANYITVGGKRQFTDGPPGTTITGDHLTAVQEEIMAVIEGAGIAPDSNDNTQLFQAINSLRPMQRTLNTVELGGLITQATASGSYVFGPTASGADIIFSQLDDIPVGTRFILLDMTAQLNHGVDAGAACDFSIIVRYNDANNYKYGTLSGAAYLQNQVHSGAGFFIIPLDVDRKFKVSFNINKTASTVLSIGCTITGYI